MSGQGKRNAKAEAKRADVSGNSGSHVARNALIGTIAAAGLASVVRYASKHRGGSDATTDTVKPSREI
jgi:hypothetical protein